MKTKILFPCSAFNSKEVDSNFENEYQVSKTLGIESFFYDHDLLAVDDKVKFFGLKEDEAMIILRGWMMNPYQYKRLFDALERHDQHLYTSPDAYVQCHYLKNSYNYIKFYTARTMFSDKFDEETLGEMFDTFPDGIILKDYVKSEKHIPGLFRIPKETSHEQLFGVVKRFIEARGSLFNEGVAFREFIELKKYEGEVNEWRVFVFKGRIAAVEQNSNINANLNVIAKPPDNLIGVVAHKLSQVSVFYTFDVAETDEGEWMVIETGDGQVSGLAPNQNPIGLYNSFVTPVQIKRQ